MPVAVIPLAYFGVNSVYMWLATPAGVLSDRIGRWPLLVVGYVVCAVVYAGFAVAIDALVAVGLLLIYGVYYALTEGVGRALINDLVPTSLRASAMGTYATATGTGTGTGTG